MSILDPMDHPVYQESPGFLRPVRRIDEETTAVPVSPTSTALSSHQALFYHLLSPHFVRRVTTRLTVGGKKYGIVQWRQGINDAEYMTDRFNHMVEHLLLFMADGNEKDDNLGAMAWALHGLMEVERLCPEVFSQIYGISHLFGPSATVFHEKEMEKKGAAQL